MSAFICRRVLGQGVKWLLLAGEKFEILIILDSSVMDGYVVLFHLPLTTFWLRQQRATTSL